MLRVAIVIGTALAFAILGLVAGHLCVSVYHGAAIFDAAGHTIVASQHRDPGPEFILGCYLATPVFGTVIGYLVAILSLKLFAPHVPS